MAKKSNDEVIEVRKQPVSLAEMGALYGNEKESAEGVGSNMAGNSNSARIMAAHAEILSHTGSKPYEKVIDVDPDQIDENPYQNRCNFKDLDSLAESIQTLGQKQPCLVRKVGSRYELASGERRVRACRLLKIPVKVMVEDLTDQQMQEICLAENENRKDTNMLEKYIGIEMLLKEKHERDYILKRIDISQSTYFRLKKLSSLKIELIKSIAKTTFAEKLNSRKIEEISDLFEKGQEEHYQALSMQLSEMVQDMEGVVFDREVGQTNETNKLADRFVSFAKKLVTPEKMRAESKPSVETIAYLYQGKPVGEGKITQKMLTLSVSKENLPEDLFKRLTEHIQAFFQAEAEDPATTA